MAAPALTAHVPNADVSCVTVEEVVRDALVSRKTALPRLVCGKDDGLDTLRLLVLNRK
ncbi:hypothetical protein AWENTII_009139 [Aspergillus wentii]